MAALEEAAPATATEEAAAPAAPSATEAEAVAAVRALAADARWLDALDALEAAEAVAAAGGAACAGPEADELLGEVRARGAAFRRARAETAAEEGDGDDGAPWIAGHSAFGVDTHYRSARPASTFEDERLEIARVVSGTTRRACCG